MSLHLPSCYITGTDTGIGKTHATAALLRMVVAEGRRAVGMKPVASGCIATPDGWQSEDALALIAAANVSAPYDAINPYALPLPVAPEIAAAEAGIDIHLDVLREHYAALQGNSEVVLVEGVGGWLAPLTTTLEQAEIVRAFDLPVVMVVGLRLGCVHHARATAAAIHADGCQLLGWIANAVDPEMAHREDNIRILQRVLSAPLLLQLPYSTKQ